MLRDPKRKELLLIRHGISGLLLLPLLGWLIAGFISITGDPFGYLPIFFFSPINAICGIFFTLLAMYHLSFDLKYIIFYKLENKNYRNIFMLLVDVTSIVTAVSVVIAILMLHFTGIIVG